MATLYLVVGLPGAGKSTYAKTLATKRRALLLSPDSWMLPLFGQPEAGGKRDLLEGRLISLALDALRLSTSVVLDFGFWTRDERSALRCLAESVGASADVVYLPVDRDTQLSRVRQRSMDAPQSSISITETELDIWRAAFEEPDAAELDGGAVPAPPAGWTTWSEWARARWPTLTAMDH